MPFADWGCDVSLGWSKSCKANGLVAAENELQKESSKLLFVTFGLTNLPNPETA